MSVKIGRYHLILETIAFVSTMNGEPWGGSEELWSGVASRLSSLGYSVSANIVKWPKRSDKIERLAASGISVHERSESGGIALLYKKMRPKSVFRWLDRVKPDLVVISQGAHIDGADWMKACFDRKLPYATIAQSASEHFWPADGQAKMLAELYRGARRSYFVSRRNIELTETQLAIHLEQAEVIRNPFTVDYNIQLPWPIFDGTWNIACVGRLNAYTKGQDLVLNLMAQSKWQQRPIKVTFYGTGCNEERLQWLAKLKRIANVRFAGHVSDVSKIWQENHAMILASRFEGLPLVEVEAMLCSRMCIVTDVAGNAELINDGIDGFVAEAATVKHLDDALERAWECREQWRVMGLSAAKSIRENIPTDPIGEATVKILSLLPGSRSH